MSKNRATRSYEYNVICDVCGWKFKASQLKKRWDGLMVCEKDWEARHIADFYKTRNDAHRLPFTRPQPTVDDESIAPPLNPITSPPNTYPSCATRSSIVGENTVGCMIVGTTL